MFFNKKYNPEPINNNYQVYPMDITNMRHNEYQELRKTAVYFRKNTKFYKKKSDFTADYWINFKDKKNPFIEIDI